MSRALLLSVCVVSLGGASLSGAQPTVSTPRLQVAEGIYVFMTPPYGDVGLDGNSVAIVSNDGVLVFDSNGTPAAARAVLAQIRAITSQPVRYLVNSHWHWDHWYGAEIYKDAFPGIQIITHENSRRMMMGPALAFNRPGLERDLPGYIASLEKKVAAARTAGPAAADLPRLESLLETDRFFLDQKQHARHTFANVTFTSQLDIYMGERHIQVLHHDRAVTPGDSFLYLPNEKIVVSGDLLVNPVPFALSAYPSGWLGTLERIDALDASILVPGHGEPLRSEELLHATIAIFRELLRQGRDARAKGLDADQARDAILPSLQALKSTMTRNDPALDGPFRVYLVDWYLHRVYDELAGPLTDDIAPIPEK